MTISTDLLIINHLISVSITSPYLPLVFTIQTPQLLTILYLKFEQVQFTTHHCV